MTKRKKTKQEKMIMDLHRKLQMQTQTVSSSTSSIKDTRGYTYTATVATPKRIVDVSINNLLLIRQDLIKTTIVTILLILLQGILFYLLTAHILKIPMVSY